MVACRSSGFLTSDTLIRSGQCKLVSVHAVNVSANSSGTGAGNAVTLNLYDNTAASGTIVAKIHLSGTNDGTNFFGTTFEMDLHGVICQNGLYADIVIPAAVAGGHSNQNSATSGFVINFA